MNTKAYMIRRIIMCVIGVVICGISVGFFKTAAFGVDPFTSLMCGLDEFVSIKYGTLYVITNVILLTFSLVFDRHYIGLGTFVNIFFLGYITQYTEAALGLISSEPPVFLRIFYLLFAVVMICISSALYFTADMGVSTYDAIALIISEKWKLLPFKYCRIITDTVCIIIGVTLYLLSGNTLLSLIAIINVGTIIIACFMGPLIEVFKQKLAIPLLNGKNNN